MTNGVTSDPGSGGRAPRRVIVLPEDGQAESVPLIPGLEVVDELGRGGESVVYHVRREGRDYALKMLPSTPYPDQVLTALRRTSAWLAMVAHPGLPMIHEVGAVGVRPYAVMDLVAGRPLADVLEAGPLRPDVVRALAVDLAGSLAAVHGRGLVHRDLKPENVIIDPDGVAHLIDFGLTERHAVAGGETVVGTLTYAAPEQVGTLHRAVDGRSDLYSLGVVLFRCLAGRLPFVGDDLGDLLRQHAIMPAPDLRAVVPGIPDDLADAVAVLLAKDPDDRYRNASELLADLLRAHPELEERLPVALVDDRTDSGDIDLTLCGRDVEFASLGDRWRRAREGTAGAALVRGEAGSGKSRLVREVVAATRSGRGIVLAAKCSEDDQNPMAAMRSAIDRWACQVAALPPQARERAVAVLSAAAGELAPLLAEISGEIAGLLGVERLGVADLAGQLPATVADLLVGLARNAGGLLLHLDDVQWLDPGSLRVVEALAARMGEGGVPLLLAATARSEPEYAVAVTAFRTALGDRLDLDLSLGGLDATGVRDLVAAMLPGAGGHPTLPTDEADPLTEILVAAGNGSPFVVQEYLRAAVDAGLLRPGWAGWELDTAGLQALDLPQDAIGLVLRRVAGLGPRARQLLTTAAALGIEFDAEPLRAVHHLPAEDVATELAEAVARRLLARRGEGRYLFVHDRVRESMLSGVGEDDLARLHARIAQALTRDDAGRAGDVVTEIVGLATGGPASGERDFAQADRIYALARHQIAAGPHAVPDRLAAACLRAGRQALADHAPAKAIDYLERALTTGEPVPPVALVMLGVALSRGGRCSEAAVRLEEALALETDPLVRAAACVQLAEVQRSTWRPEESLRAIRRGLAELGVRLPAGTPGFTVFALASLAITAVATVLGLPRRPVSGPARERLRLVVVMLWMGAYVTSLTLRPYVEALFLLATAWPLRRLQHGPEFARTSAGWGFLLGMMGLRRASRRRAARAASDPSVQADPRVAAAVRWLAGAGRYMTGRDAGEAWGEVLRDHGTWLDAGMFADADASIVWEAILAGRLADAEAWHDVWKRWQSAAGRAERTPMVLFPAAIDAAFGRAASAAGELAATLRVLGPALTLGMHLNVLSVHVHVLLEQDETGPELDAVIDEFTRLRVRRSRVLRQHRPVYVLIAFARLAQARRHEGGQRRDQQALDRAVLVAAAAVAEAERAASTPLLRALARVARADLLVLSGRSERALRLLGDLQPVVPDAPRVEFEALRVKARAWAATGRPEAAARAAGQARTVALAAGMPHRVRWIDAEFVRPPGSGLGPEASSPLGVTSAGRTSAGRRRGAAAGESSDLLAAATNRIDGRRLEALEAVSIAAAGVLEPHTIARVTLEETLRILAAERALLFLAEDDGGLALSVGLDADGREVTEATGYSLTLVETVRVEGRPLVVTGTEEGEALGSRSIAVHGLRSILAAPVALDGRVLGVLYADSHVAKGIFSSEDAALLTALSTHIAIALQTARAARLELSVEAARRERALAEALGHAVMEMSACLDPKDVLARLRDAAERMLPGERSWVLTGEKVPAAVTGATGVIVGDAGLPPPAAPSAAPSGASAGASSGASAGQGSWLCLPVLSEGQVPGAVVLASPDAGAYGAAEIELAGTLAAQAMTAYDRARLFSRVQELATADDLTGLTNRRHFFELAARDLASARAHGHDLVGVMIDIDRFKQVNDTYGHPTGDDVIREVAARLSGSLRTENVVGRYGGEEFAVLMAPTHQDVVACLEGLRRAVGDDPVPTRSGPLTVTVSIGAAVLCSSDVDVPALLARADAALYAAKAAGRDQVRLAPES